MACTRADIQMTFDSDTGKSKSTLVKVFRDGYFGLGRSVRSMVIYADQLVFDCLPSIF